MLHLKQQDLEAPKRSSDKTGIITFILFFFFAVHLEDNYYSSTERYVLLCA